ncbi:putative phospholipid biosynthesis acyltransferase [Oryzomicrobium terrae]|uniref:Putative phospholipid biosynthesis acyltransferase n=1 Tax=Oryzomicrobium terrae TaxID=1735038 RepID=A0A5C1EBQ8_9RHOO|nr:putative phospholipid biosynthesis acyltransferase [Oryzomicrobium terrae]
MPFFLPHGLVRHLPLPLRRLHATLAVTLGWVLLGVLCLGWSLLAVLVYPLLPRRAGLRFGRLGIMGGFRLYLAGLSALGACRFDLKALDQLRDSGPLIIAPNHPCLLDAVMVLSRLPDVACIMKGELMDNLFLGAGARLARYIRNDSLFGMILLAVSDLREGNHLLVFPEGTRTSGGPVGPFKGSVALVAHRAQVPIQTVFIETDSPYLGKGWPVLRRPDLPITYRIRLGRRFDPPQDPHVFTGELEAYFRTELSRAREAGEGSAAPCRCTADIPVATTSHPS